MVGSLFLFGASVSKEKRQRRSGAFSGRDVVQTRAYMDVTCIFPPRLMDPNRSCYHVGVRFHFTLVVRVISPYSSDLRVLSEPLSMRKTISLETLETLPPSPPSLSDSSHSLHGASGTHLRAQDHLERHRVHEFSGIQTPPGSWRIGVGLKSERLYYWSPQPDVLQPGQWTNLFGVRTMDEYGK